MKLRKGIGCVVTNIPKINLKKRKKIKKGDPKVKIKVLLASSSIDLVKSQEGYRKEALSEGNDINIIAPRGCPPSTENQVDVVFAAPHIYEEAIKAEEEGYQAVSIDCFLEPGLEACKMGCNIPVVGAGEAAFVYSFLFSKKVAVIIPVESSLKAVENQILKYGVGNRVIGVFSAGIHVLDLDNYNKSLKALLPLVEEAKKQGAEAIILGCTVMGPLTKELKKQGKIPVIDPGVIALKMAEVMVAMGDSYPYKVQEVENH